MMATTQTTLNSTEVMVCPPAGNKWTYVFLMPLPIVSWVINILIWLSATFYRKKLQRQSYVYSCVTSTLLSNALFLSFHLWDEVEGFRMSDVEGTPDPPPMMELLWSLCTAVPVSLVFVVCGNLTVLVYVMLESAYFQKSAARNRVGKSLKHNSVLDLEVKRRRAAFLVVFVWALPAVLTIIAVVLWNCAKDCACPPGSLGEICPRSKGCSRTWVPMKNSFIGVNVALWFAEVITLVYITIAGIKKFQDYNLRNRTSTAMTEVSLTTRKSGYGFGSHSSDDPTSEDHREMSAKKVKEGDDEVFHPTNKTYITSHLRLNPRLRLVCLLTIVFILCTVMVPVSFFIDLAVDDYPVIRYRLATMVLLQVYTLLCPLLLLKCMPDLRSAVNRLAACVSSTR